VQAIFRLRIEGTTICSRTALGSGCGNVSGFAAEVKAKAGLGFRASAAFTVLKPISMLLSGRELHPLESSALHGRLFRQVMRRVWT
jgi:hypothetical protein